MRLHNFLNAVLIIGMISETACSRYDEYGIESSKPVTDIKIEALSDSTLFNNVNCMVAYDGDIYMSVDQRMQIIRLDSNLNLRNTVGRAGRATNEFIYINSFYITDNRIIVGNPGKLAYLEFQIDGKFLSILEQSYKRYSIDSRFLEENSIIYFSKVDADAGTSIAKLDIVNGSYDKFGKMINFGSPTKNEVQNRRHIFKLGEKIIAVTTTYPSIEIYNENLQLVDSFDMRTIRQINLLHEIANQDKEIQSNPNAAYSIISDAYLYGKYLYVLFYPPTNKILYHEDEKYPGIFVFDVSDKIKPVKHLTFQDNIIKICISNNNIYAALASGGVIIKYKMR